VFSNLENALGILLIAKHQPSIDSDKEILQFELRKYISTPESSVIQPQLEIKDTTKNYCPKQKF
jgi:hypothetical protein